MRYQRRQRVRYEVKSTDGGMSVTAQTLKVAPATVSKALTASGVVTAGSTVSGGSIAGCGRECQCSCAAGSVSVAEDIPAKAVAASVGTVSALSVAVKGVVVEGNGSFVDGSVS
jgi:hypothetical protein